MKKRLLSFILCLTFPTILVYILADFFSELDTPTPRVSSDNILIACAIAVALQVVVVFIEYQNKDRTIFWVGAMSLVLMFVIPFYAHWCIRLATAISTLLFYFFYFIRGVDEMWHAIKIKRKWHTKTVKDKWGK